MVTPVGSSDPSDILTSPVKASAWEGRNPFVADVCPGPLAVAEEQTIGGLNQDVLDQLLESVEQRSGAPLKLLTAPRAGYGKTHLLGRVVQAAGEEAVVVPLAFRTGDTLNQATLIRRGIETLSQAAGKAEGWSRLRESSAGLIASLLHGLIQEGLVPSANPEQALRVLQGPVKEIFAAEGSAHMIGDWLKKHAGGLRPVLARRVARQIPVKVEMADVWLDRLMAQAYEGGAEGVAEMIELATRDEEAGIPVWLRMLGLWRPVVLMVDHLDGYYRNPDAGVTIAAMLMDLVETQGLHVLLSLNQDVWQATFGHHLPSALEDRLTASQVLLKGLREADAAALLNLRLCNAKVSEEEAAEFAQFLNIGQYFLGRPPGSVSARVFLRHCARQWELFQHSVPLSFGPKEKLPEAREAMEGAAGPDDAGLVPEVLPLTAEEEVPSLFDDDTSAGMQTLAETLSEPVAALPQNEVSDPVATPSAEAAGQAAEAGPELGANEQHAATASDWGRVSDEAAASAQAMDAAADQALAAGAVVTPSSDAFVRLREMLHHLRQPGARARATEDTMVDEAPAPARQTVASPVPVSVPPRGAIQPVAASPAKVTLKPASPKPADALLGRFEALRLQLLPEAEAQPLDYAKLADLIRLAGRRFPLVRLSEHELPGLTGCQTMVWSVQGVELIFGLAPFSETAYWRVLSGFAAGRLTDLAVAAERDDSTVPRLKMVTFKSAREQAGWETLIAGPEIPDPLKNQVDAVHLDSLSMAALYAMQRIIKDAETGAVEAEPTQVMTVLVRELDFFWKRITRA